MYLIIRRSVLTLIGTFALLVSPTLAEQQPNEIAVPLDQPVTKAPGSVLWKWSLASYATGNALDVISSVGPHYGRETNSFLADRNGNIRVGKAIAAKSGAFAAIGVAQYLILRKWPSLTRFFTVVNFGWGGAESALAVHNFSLRK